MMYPTFYVAFGNERFAPTPAHPGEDAGGDIRACIQDYDSSSAVAFYNSLSNQPPSAAFNGKGHLYVDGEKRNFASKKAFTDEIEAAGGAVFLAPGDTVLVNSGFKVELNDLSQLGEPWSYLVGYYQIVSRSGLACKHGIIVTNSPGIVDSGYRDWVKVSLTNRGRDFHAFTHGARIAQGIYSLAVDHSGAITARDDMAISDSARSTGGFGSTDVA